MEVNYVKDHLQVPCLVILNVVLLTVNGQIGVNLEAVQSLVEVEHNPDRGKSLRLQVVMVNHAKEQTMTQDLVTQNVVKLIVLGQTGLHGKSELFCFSIKNYIL